MSQNHTTSTLLVWCLILLTACEYATSIQIIHQASQRFYQSGDDSLAELTPFKSAGVLFVVDIKAITHETFTVWLGLYSRQKNTRVKINSATLTLGDIRKSVGLPQALTISANANLTGFYKSSTRLTDFNKSALDAVSEQTPAILTIHYKIDGKSGHVHFELIKKTTQHPVFPT